MHKRFGLFQLYKEIRNIFFHTIRHFYNERVTPQLIRHRFLLNRENLSKRDLVRDKKDKNFAGKC